MKKETKNMGLRILTLFLSMCLNIVLARKSFLVKQQHPSLYAPKVSNYDTSLKLFDKVTPKGEIYRFVVDNQI